MEIPFSFPEDILKQVPNYSFDYKYDQFDYIIHFFTRAYKNFGLKRFLSVFFNLQMTIVLIIKYDCYKNRYYVF